jgi:predicted nucleic acid-binding protein
MDLVIDANIVVAFLIKPYIVLDILTKNDLNLFAPQYLFEEIDEKIHIITNKKNISQEKINYLLNYLKKQIKIVPKDVFELYLEEAKDICPDEDDIQYFALCMLLKCPLWSNDKVLKEKQNKIVVYPTHELIKKL